MYDVFPVFRSFRAHISVLRSESSLCSNILSQLSWQTYWFFFCQNKKRQAWFISSSPLMITVGSCLQSFSPSSSRTLRNSLPGLWWSDILLPDPHTSLSPSLSADIFPSSVHLQPTDFMVSPGCISLIHVSSALFRSLSDSGVLKFSVQNIFARLFNDWSLTLLS